MLNPDEDHQKNRILGPKSVGNNSDDSKKEAVNFIQNSPPNNLKFENESSLKDMYQIRLEDDPASQVVKCPHCKKDNTLENSMWSSSNRTKDNSFFKLDKKNVIKMGSNPYSNNNFGFSGDRKQKYSIMTEVNVNLNRQQGKGYMDVYHQKNESISLNVSFQRGDLDYKSEIREY